MTDKILLTLGLGFSVGFLFATVMLHVAAKSEVEKHPKITLEKYYFGDK